MQPQMPVTGLEEPEKSSWGCIIAIVVVLSLTALIGAALWWDWLDLGLWSNKLNDDTYISDSLGWYSISQEPFSSVEEYNDNQDTQQGTNQTGQGTGGQTPAKATPWWKRKTTIFLGLFGIASFYLGYDYYANPGASILGGWSSWFNSENDAQTQATDQTQDEGESTWNWAVLGWDEKEQPFEEYHGTSRNDALVLTDKSGNEYTPNDKSFVNPFE